MPVTKEVQKYYTELFPAKEICDFIGLINSEFRIVYKGKATTTFWDYGNFFQNSNELVQKLIQSLPHEVHSIHYGGEVLFIQKNKSFRVIRKPLVFDIDIDAYDDIRTCHCKGSKSLCFACWQLIR